MLAHYLVDSKHVFPRHPKRSCRSRKDVFSVTDGHSHPEHCRIGRLTQVPFGTPLIAELMPWFWSLFIYYCKLTFKFAPPLLIGFSSYIYFSIAKRDLFPIVPIVPGSSKFIQRKMLILELSIHVTNMMVSAPTNWSSVCVMTIHNHNRLHRLTLSSSVAPLELPHHPSPTPRLLMTQFFCPISRHRTLFCRRW